LGNQKDSVQFLQKALELSPQKQVIKIALAEGYFRLGDKVQSYKYAEEAYKATPNFVDLKTSYALIALYVGKVDEAKKIFVEVYGTEMPLDQKILKVYADVGYRQKVIGIVSQAIEKNPNSLDYYGLLAQIYIDANQRQNAIDVLKMAIKNNPSFKDQGQYYINQISAGVNP
jgi:tetratricopeptide (TPR) repeat protein